MQSVYTAIWIIFKVIRNLKKKFVCIYENTIKFNLEFGRHPFFERKDKSYKLSENRNREWNPDLSDYPNSGGLDFY